MPQIERERAEDDAAEWLLRLAEDPNDAELRARFEAWRRSHPLHAEIWDRTDRAYELLSPAMHKPTVRLTAPPRRRLVIRAAALALAAALVIAVMPTLLLHAQADIRTAAAETRALVLADGSQLRLGPESAVSIAMAENSRRVRILKGRAFFDVVPDAARPFTVQAGETRVTVVGTAFDVRRQDGGVAVSVSRGRVRVDHEALQTGGELLGAGDALTMTASRIQRRMVDPAEVADWRSGRLTVRDASIAEVIEELRPYFPGFILVADDAFSRQHVSGVYDLNDPIRTLTALAAAHQGQLRQLSPWIIQIKKSS